MTKTNVIKIFGQTVFGCLLVGALSVAALAQPAVNPFPLMQGEFATKESKTSERDASTPSLQGPYNAASYTTAIAAGMLVSFFGENLTTREEVATTVPLPRTLAGITVKVNGLLIPLFYAGPKQINAQMPREFTAGTVQVEVALPTATFSGRIGLSPSAPGIFTTDGKTAISFRQGDWVTIYATGQGPVGLYIPTGSPAPLSSLALPVLPVRVFSGSAELESASAMAPGFIGVLQVNLRVAAGTPPGNYRLSLRVGTENSQEVVLQLR